MKTLKSIILTSILTLTLVSCDMDKYPYDKIPLDSAAKSFADCQKLRTGMYRDLRIIGVSVNALASEIQGWFYSALLLWQSTRSHLSLGSKRLRKYFFYCME